MPPAVGKEEESRQSINAGTMGRFPALCGCSGFFDADWTRCTVRALLYTYQMRRVVVIVLAARSGGVGSRLSASLTGLLRYRS